MARPSHIPNIVSQALGWLDKMNFMYHYHEDGECWEFLYKGFYVIIPNYVEEDEIGLIAPVIIDNEDEEICKMVFDFSLPLLDKQWQEYDLQYVGNGICQLIQCRKSTGKRLKLYKYQFVDMLNEIHKLHKEVQFVLDISYEMLFNPPPQILADILQESENRKNKS